MITVIARDESVSRVIRVVIAFLRAGWFPAPRYWPISTVPPMQSPTMVLVRINVICPPIVTPDMLSLPQKFPTISMSATLYKD